jgi:hypothetical protein
MFQNSLDIKLKATIKKNETYKIETPSTQPKFCFKCYCYNKTGIRFSLYLLNNKLTAKPTVKKNI